MIPGFFITGTDTDIGKTYVAGQLADAFARFLSVTYAKPIQTGCEKKADGLLHAPDFDYVIAGGAQMTRTYEQHVPYRFEPACSPHLAARMAKQNIELQVITEAIKEVSRDMRCTLVEGAGGLLVPLNDTEYMLDLIKALAMPVILVTSPRLGTLNHTFLTYQTLRRYDITVAAVIFNETAASPHDFIFEDNRRTIQDTIAPTPMFSIDFGNSFPEQLVEFCHDLAKKFL